MSLQESYYGDNNTIQPISSSRWQGQVFTASDDYDLTSIKMKMYRNSGSPGTLTCELRAVSSGLPTGSVLSSGTIDGNALTTNTAGEVVEFTMSSYSIVNSTEYAFTVKAQGAGFPNTAGQRRDNGSPSYSGGTFVWTTNSGSSWNKSTLDDLWFEVYGSGTTYVETSGTIAAQSAVANANLEILTYISISGTIAAQSVVENASLGQTAVSIGEIQAVKRLVVIGNSRVYYEAI